MHPSAMEKEWGVGGREVGGPAEVNILSFEKRYRMGQSWSRV